MDFVVGEVSIFFCFQTPVVIAGHQFGTLGMAVHSPPAAGHSHAGRSPVGQPDEGTIQSPVLFFSPKGGHGKK